MRGIGRWLVAVVVGAVSLTACGADTQVRPEAQTTKPAPSTSPAGGRVVVVYDPAKSPDLTSVKDTLQAGRAVDDLADWVSGFLILPKDLPVTLKECGEDNAFYQAGAITICYDYMKLFLDLAKRDTTNSGRTEAELTDFMVNNAKETFTHELGHAAVDLLNLPITGKEEDVADQLSAYLLTQNKEDVQVLLDSAEGYWLVSNDTEALPFADTHSLNQQRAYNFACWLYGSDPAKYKDLVGDEDSWLPKDRSENCESEYDQLARGWSTLLAPHLKD